MESRIVIAYNTGDQRKRYRHLYEPLQALIRQNSLNMEVQVLGHAPGIWGALRAVKGDNWRHPGKTCVIYFGADISGLIWAIVCRLRKIKILIRLGGNHVKTHELLMKDALKNRSCFSLTKYFSLWIATRIALQLADGVVAVSEVLSERLKNDRQIRPECPVFIVHQAVNMPLGEQDSLEAKKKRYKDLHLVTVSNFFYNEKVEPIKVLIDAFLSKAWEKHCEDLPPILYSIVGGGKKLEVLKEYVATRLGMLNSRGVQVRILGHIPDPNNLYQSADLFLYGSEHDCVPNVLLEAQINGLPIVVNDLRDFLSLLREGRNASFYQTGNPNSAASVLARLIKSPQKMSEMAQSNREDARKNWSVEAVKKKLDPLVEYCLRSA